ncbi:hypothetical protein A5623_02245 [Mycobacterium colombiense]|nr:hypothetical protein A5623_02245 [Mycobacterium colombiense]OBJ18269.1 hypothetical protein A9W93_19295 [Mycobacterium colombiense]
MIRPRGNGRRYPALGLTPGKAGVDNRQLVAAAVDVVELLDLSLELLLDLSLELEPDLSLELEPLDPESLDEEPLLELDDFLPDSRLSVR